MRDDDENIWDNGRFSVVISCELSSRLPFEETFRVGATPGENWVNGFSAVERLVEYFFVQPRLTIQSRSTSCRPYPASSRTK